jgi:hypothetical protein
VSFRCRGSGLGMRAFAARLHAASVARPCAGRNFRSLRSTPPPRTAVAPGSTLDDGAQLRRRRNARVARAPRLRSIAKRTARARARCRRENASASVRCRTEYAASATCRWRYGQRHAENQRLLSAPPLASSLLILRVEP